MSHMHFMGFGYCASYVFARLKHKGFSFSASAREASKASHLQNLNITPTNTPPAHTTHVLCSAPSLAPPALKSAWLGYFSSTGVYGDHAGAWVDESSECRAQTPRTLARLTTETLWQKAGGFIFRLGGIYGPSRNALEETIHGASRAIDKPGQFFSRIHVEDIAGSVVACMQNNTAPTIYNVVDDAPSSARAVIEYAHKLLKLPPPDIIPFEHAQLSPMAVEFYAANRRVSNAKLKRELAYELLYPTYHEGLNAIYASLTPAA